MGNNYNYKESRNNKPIYGYNYVTQSNLYKVQSVCDNNVAS